MLTFLSFPLLLGIQSKINFQPLHPKPLEHQTVTKFQTPKQPVSKPFFLRALATLIGKVESYGSGDYNAANAGSAGDLGINGLKRLSGRDCSQITLGEIKSMQRRGLLYAVGRYQLIPRTLQAAQVWSGLKDQDYFTPQNQDKMLISLIKNKRPRVWAYLQGKGSINDAVSSLAKEWSGLPTLSGHSYYSGRYVTKTAVSEVKTALIAGRQEYLQQI